ncbi:MAG: 30S ribosomal protein S2 [Candidatus Parvarchaeota archaeon]|nr:30S ribosomal protein S2 [Candidatus Parvarchaeota archaeon]
MNKADKLEAYKKYGVRIGTKGANKFMEKFVFKRIPNKFVIFNVKMIDERIKLGAKLLNNYKRKEVLLVSTFDEAYYAVYNFSRIMGVSVNFGRYLAGSLTNISYDNFFEPKIVFVTDPLTDRRAIKDAKRINIPVMAICNNDSSLRFIDLIIPGNNKKAESVGFILFLLANDMANDKERSVLSKITFEDFISKEISI